MNSYKYCFILLILLMGCQPREASPLKTAEWLIGTWQNDLPASTVYEQWWKTGDLSLAGRSFIVLEGDTLVFETIELNVTEDGIFYIPTVKDQNDGEPVVFAASQYSDERMVFENREHDFPQLIAYRKLSPDSLEARIYGLQRGREREQFFYMKRIE